MRPYGVVRIDVVHFDEIPIDDPWVVVGATGGGVGLAQGDGVGAKALLLKTDDTFRLFVLAADPFVTTTSFCRPSISGREIEVGTGVIKRTQ